MADLLFQALGLNGRKSVLQFSKRAQVAVEQLRYYNDNNVLPADPDLSRICAASGLDATTLQLLMGKVDRRLLERLRANAFEVAALLQNAPFTNQEADQTHTLVHTTELGRLYQGDCMSLLPTLPSESVDMAFADPPFNLSKLYPSGIDDDLRESQYITWCEDWLHELIRILKPGGSLFVWNLPRWNIHIGRFLADRLTFKHWISVDVKASLPIPGRLYPSHYSLLYFVKGQRARVFHPDRLPMPVCPSCAADLRDYGGYKDKMNPDGVNLTDVWYDIPPVRHSRHKKREGANELSIRLLDRVIELATDEGDLVLDPFGGAGTTYAVAEIKQRRWIGIELGPVDDIISRLRNLIEEEERLTLIRRDINCLFTEETLAKREQIGLWTHETVRTG